MFVFFEFWYSALMRPSSSTSNAYDGGLPHFPYVSFSIFVCQFIYARYIVKKKMNMIHIKMRMIYKQCNCSILLLFYDFKFENVEIKTNLNLNLNMCAHAHHERETRSSGSRGAFHQAFCQWFSLTNFKSYWNPCVWLAESKFVSEKHWQNVWWNAPLGSLKDPGSSIGF